MWLQVAAAVLLGTTPVPTPTPTPSVVAAPTSLPIPSQATKVSTWTSVYSGDGMMVVSPAVSASASPTPEIEVSVRADMDIISGASVDVRTAASPRGFEENRTGADLAVTYRPDLLTRVAVSYLPSFEPDYESHGVGASVSREWFDRRLTTQLAYRLSMDQVGRLDSPSDWRSMTLHAVGAEGTVVMDPVTLLTFALEGQYQQGYMASLYRFVPIHQVGGLETDPAISVGEAVPEERVRAAAATSLRRALGGGFFASGYYRLYLDTWGVVSHTGELEAQYAAFSDALLVGLSARGYGQNAASFYRGRYELEAGTLPVYRSADKQLSDSWSILGALRAELALGHGVRLTGKVEWLHQAFGSFTALPVRTAFVTAFGAAATF